MGNKSHRQTFFSPTSYFKICNIQENRSPHTGVVLKATDSLRLLGIQGAECCRQSHSKAVVSAIADASSVNLLTKVVNTVVTVTAFNAAPSLGKKCSSGNADPATSWDALCNVRFGIKHALKHLRSPALPNTAYTSNISWKVLLNRLVNESMIHL